jgi:SAM-dependent methyltransferase
MPLPENTYGIFKRLQFAREVVGRTRPRHVLDIGCGSGMQLTAPLAAAFPDVEFLGVDTDAGVIRFARERNHLPNLRFLSYDELDNRQQFGLVIASEVIEHVEDPIEFLQRIKRSLSSDGTILLTVPNGYGPFELTAFFDSVFRVSLLLKKLRGGHANARCAGEEPVDTTAFSPHISFFSLAVIRKVFKAAGLHDVHYRPRTWLCGLGFDSIIRGPALLTWNARVSERLPAWCVSDWMFVLEPNAMPEPYVFRRNWYARIRSHINRQQCRLLRCA